ncbi:MAG: CPBP family intramembrane metalloprotease [Gammaproteobacteria bacterium]|nr:CPBP family intramembrane metalloprotease [Gammaproteobacteria bacterium]
MSTARPAIYCLLQALLALVAVYLPTFLITSLLIASGVFGKLSKPQAQLVSIPIIIIVSLGIALAIMAWLAWRRGQNFADYGLRSVSWRRLIAAAVPGLLFGSALYGLHRLLPLGASPDLGELSRWQVVLFFWIGAPIQEETIFRGLIQTVAQTRYAKPLQIGRLKLPVSALISAALFALVHLATLSLGASPGDVLFIVCGALLLGLVAGWLRARTGSVLPGMVVHALFNIIVD